MATPAEVIQLHETTVKLKLADKEFSLLLSDFQTALMILSSHMSRSDDTTGSILLESATATFEITNCTILRAATKIRGGYGGMF